MRRDERGFSLIELLIVVALIGIAAGIAIPSILSQLPTWHTNGATRQVAATLMAARLRAIQNNVDYRVVFTLGAVDSFGVSKIDRFDENTNGNTTEWINEGPTNLAPSDVNITTNCITNMVQFNPNGTSNACSIWVRDQTGNIQRTITLTSSTGRINVQYQ